jgi:hypothetical protein
MPEKKNQHFVSKFYLRGFTQTNGDSVLWWFSKVDAMRPVTKSPARAASESYFYSVQRDDGGWDHSVEESLNSAETESAPALRRLIESGHAVEVDRLRVASFIGLTYLRGKAMRDHAVAEGANFKDPKTVAQIVERGLSYQRGYADGNRRKQARTQKGWYNRGFFHR